MSASGFHQMVKRSRDADRKFNMENIQLILVGPRTTFSSTYQTKRLSLGVGVSKMFTFI